MKKNTFILVLLLLVSFYPFAEDAAPNDAPLSADTSAAELETDESLDAESDEDADEAEEAVDDAEEESAKPKKRAADLIDLCLPLSPAVIFCTDKAGAPSPVVFPIAFGITIPKQTLVSFQPRISFFTGYYSWHGKYALPAEIESRTGTALSFMVDLPAAFTFRIRERHAIETTIGAGFLLRGAFLSNGVGKNESGVSGSAEGDVKKINEWFWKGGNFFFVQTSVAYLFRVSEKLEVGPETRCYLPIGSFVAGNGFYHGILSGGIKVGISL